MSAEKLTISFSLWGLLCGEPGGVYEDWDSLMQEYVDRGFNCIRLEGGHGLLTDRQGNPIHELTYHAPFGPHTKYIRQFDCVAAEGTVCFRQRLLELFRAADRYGVTIILSSWFYLHTYWLLDEAVAAPLFAMTTEEKIEHFSRDLDRILTLLEENGLIHCVAFAELFNEMNAMPSQNPPIGTVAICSRKQALRIRTAHEGALDRLRQKHPTVKLAYDVASPFFRTDLLPRNVDVLNFHNYFLWNAYSVFEQNCITDTLEEPELPESLRRYLNGAVTNDDVIESMPGAPINTVYNWIPRIRVYADIAADKTEAVGRLIEEEIVAHYDRYLEVMKRHVDHIVSVRDSVVPQAELVMGEGVSYCCSNRLTFEEKSDAYWRLIEEQANYLREKGFWGTVVRTTSGPEDPSWQLCKERYLQMNRLFAER